MGKDQSLGGEGRFHFNSLRKVKVGVPADPFGRHRGLPYERLGSESHPIQKKPDAEMSSA
jgi:hypothetical protein